VPASDEGNHGYVDDGEEPQSDGSDGGEYVDEEEVENAIANSGGGGGGGGGSGTPATTTGLKTVPWGKKHIRHEPDDEDDELMMYAKDKPHKVRPRHENLPQRPPYRKSIADATVQHLSATNASAQKRRTTETGSAGVARAKRRR